MLRLLLFKSNRPIPPDTIDDTGEFKIIPLHTRHVSPALSSRIINDRDLIVQHPVIIDVADAEDPQDVAHQDAVC